MPINMDNFIFHSSRIPFGAVVKESKTLAIGGAVPFVGGRRVLSDLIPVSSPSISPRIVYTIPSGTWYLGPPMVVVASGTRLMGVSFNYRSGTSPNLRFVEIRPIVVYETEGVRIGVQMYMSYLGTAAASVTVPAADLVMQVYLDVIPDNIT